MKGNEPFLAHALHVLCNLYGTLLNAVTHGEEKNKYEKIFEHGVAEDVAKSIVTGAQNAV